jgi:uncharacterized protein (DUF2236 family)
MGAAPGLIPPGSIARRVDGELILLLGGGRALLMQLAHPLVARGVAEHSDFRRDPFARLRRTLDATNAIVFGSEAEARAAAAAVNAVHRRVVGDGYRADDPDLLMWVHATLVDTALLVHERFLRPLSPDDAERYYQESTAVAEALGAPRDRQPVDLAAFRQYVDGMVVSLEVSDQAREVAGAVFHPRLPMVTGPFVALGRQASIGLLPERLRRGYGFDWDGRRQLALDAAALASRRLLPLLPPALRRRRWSGPAGVGSGAWLESSSPMSRPCAGGRGRRSTKAP